jgi:hypothetical protein
MIRRIRTRRGEYFETTDGRQYGRIVGGLAWPQGGKPGYHVVIAENLGEDIRLKARLMTVIKEAETVDVAGLVRFCQDRQAECQVQDWYGNTENKPMMAVFYQLTQDEPSQRQFNLCRASHAGDPQGLGYFLPVIKEFLKGNRKILHFREGSKLPGYLAEMGPETLNRNPEEYPPIAALGYALAELFENPPEEDENEQDYYLDRHQTGRSAVTGY